MFIFTFKNTSNGLSITTDSLIKFFNVPAKDKYKT